MNINLRNESLTIYPLILILLIIFFTSIATAQTTKEESTESSKYVPENTRARLPEARKCIGLMSGNSWGECRYNCADICNEISDTYARGVCNGVLIQSCCGQHPSECK